MILCGDFNVQKHEFKYGKHASEMRGRGASTKQATLTFLPQPHFSCETSPGLLRWLFRAIMFLQRLTWLVWKQGWARQDN